MKETPPDEGLLAEPGSEEAQEAISEKLELARKEDISPSKQQNPPSRQPEDDEWDDNEPESDPFAKASDRKARKLAMREQAAKKASSRKDESPVDPMETTTGFRLVASEPATFDVDLSASEVSRGGMIIRGGEVLDGILDELETDLLSVDMGHAATEDLVNALKSRIIGSRVNTRTALPTLLEKALRASLRRLLEAGYWDFDKTVRALLSEDSPIIIMVVGVNGTGKTTTSAKMAYRLNEEGYSVVMAAADTFRAGAIDQLAAHAERIGVRCITSQRGGDSAVEQAKVFQSMLRFDGAVLCKMDTDANGGAAMSIAHATGRPIVMAGVGQGYEDLIPFDPEWLLDSIL